MAIVDVQDIAKYGLAFEWAKEHLMHPQQSALLLQGLEN